jgi:hypothetical protein
MREVPLPEVRLPQRGENFVAILDLGVNRLEERHDFFVVGFRHGDPRQLLARGTELGILLKRALEPLSGLRHVLTGEVLFSQSGRE